MLDHPSTLRLQLACCGAVHALARRSPALGATLATAGAAAATVGAMNRFRSAGASSSRLQAAACAALGALLPHAAAMRQLEEGGGLRLLLRAVAEHSSDSPADAAVSMCGWRAVLALLGAPGTASAADAAADAASPSPLIHSLTPTLAQAELLPLLWLSLRVHRSQPAVLCACAAALSALACEDARRAKLGRTDLFCSAERRGALQAIEAVEVLLPGVRDATLARTLCRASDALVAVAGSRGWLAPAELAALHASLRAAGAATVIESSDEHRRALRRLECAQELAAAAAARKRGARPSVVGQPPQPVQT